MLPPISSPTSPQDVQMTDLNILTSAPNPSQKLTSPVDNRPLSIHSPLSLSSVKSTKTLRNNIDMKNELNKKRTSLNLHDNGNAEMYDTSSTSSSSSVGQQPLKLATVKRCSRNLDNVRYRFEMQNDNVNNNMTDSPLFNRSSSDSDGTGQQIDTVAVVVHENGKARRTRRKTPEKPQNGHHNESDDDDNNESFIDRQNGNASDRSTQKRDSITSKESGSAASDDYFLCEKFKNTLNATLCDAVVNGAVVLDENGAADRRLSLELLSPHEGPLGRRYAEIAPSKNNANANNKW